MRRVLAAVWLLFLASPSFAQPSDFDAFWDTTKSELATIAPGTKLVPDAAHTDDKVSCFKVSYNSIRTAIRAWYCRPTGVGKFPAALISPWYAQDRVEPPMALARAGVAALAYQGRGFEVDQSSYPQENYWYVLSGILDPQDYVYREFVSHSFRGIDFLAGRPEVDSNRIAVMGASQGGGLSLLVAGLDPRVSAVAADFPFLSDWERSLSAPNAPYAEVGKYLAEHPERRKMVLKTLSYFDTLNAAGGIKVPTLVQVGLKDRTCPPEGIKKVYARIASKKKRLKEYPNADHNNENAARWDSMTAWVIKTLTAP